MHGDQTHGINDLRSFFIKRKKQLDVYADKYTSKYLNTTFSYIFKTYSKEYPATLKLNMLPKKIFAKNKINIGEDSLKLFFSITKNADLLVRCFDIKDEFLGEYNLGNIF